MQSASAAGGGGGGGGSESRFVMWVVLIVGVAMAAAGGAVIFIWSRARRAAAVAPAETRTHPFLSARCVSLRLPAVDRASEQIGQPRVGRAGQGVRGRVKVAFGELAPAALAGTAPSGPPVAAPADNARRPTLAGDSAAASPKALMLTSAPHSSPGPSMPHGYRDELELIP